MLGQLYSLIKSKHVQLVIEHFRRLLKILLKLLQSSDSRVQMLVLYTLTEIFRSDELKPCYLNFVELLVLKILCIQKEQNKEVCLYYSFKGTSFIYITISGCSVCRTMCSLHDYMSFQYGSRGSQTIDHNLRIPLKSSRN